VSRPTLEVVAESGLVALGRSNGEGGHSVVPSWRRTVFDEALSGPNTRRCSLVKAPNPVQKLAQSARNYDFGAQGRVHVVANERLQRKLAAILATDVVGYSRLMGADETGTLARLKVMRRDLIDPVIAAHSGRTIKLMGDGSLVEFASVVDAVACALEIQNSVRSHNAGISEHTLIQFRMGVNVGDVIVDGDDIYGDGVNIAARIEALAEPGGVFLARGAADEVRDKLPVKLESRGERKVKNVARPIEVFRASIGEAENEAAISAESGLRSPALLMHWPPEGDRDRAPYRGLKPLETIDAGILFGRDAPIAEGVDRLRYLRASGSARLLVILGASGAGKSSFLRAGLVPQIEHDSGHFLPLPVMRPERAALFGENGLLGALEAVLPHATRAEIRAAIREGGVGVQRLLLDFRHSKAQRPEAGEAEADPPVVVLAIDQAEELFRVEGAEESAALLAIIRELALHEAPAVITIFAIRSDSYDSLQHAKALEGLPQSALPLLPMPRVSYKEVIEAPARRFVSAGGRLTIEPQLTLRLLEDIDKSGSGDALPLLAFTLEQLFLEYRRAGALRLEHYEEFGGLRGAISAAVERALARADGDPRIPRDRKEREALLRRGLIPWIAGIDPDTKTPRRNIAQQNDIPEAARPLIDLLVEERLLSTDSQTTRDPATGAETITVTIEPAHEALLRQWSLLDSWLSADFGLLATLEGIKRAARDWEANGRTEEWLTHQGVRLAESAALDARPDLAAQFEDRDRAYLEGCTAREAAAIAERERARVNELARAKAETERALAEAARAKSSTRFARILTSLSVVAAVLLGGVGVWAWEQRNAAIDQRRNAEMAADQARVATSEAVTQRNRAEKAIAKAIDASNTLVSSMVQKLRNVSGMKLSLIQAILGPALQLQDDLIASGESSPDLRRIQAVSLVEAAKTQISIGDTDGAYSSVKRAHEIMLGLVADQNDNKPWASVLSDADLLLGRIEELKGHLPESVEAYSDNLAIVERFARADPGDQFWQRSLANAYEREGHVLLRRGRLSEALEAFNKGLTILQRLAAGSPESQGSQSKISSQNLLSNTYLGIGLVLKEQGHLGQAVQSLSSSLELLERRAKSEPSNTAAQHDLTVPYWRVIEARIAQGDLVDASKTSSAFLAAMEQLSQTDPANELWQNDLTVAYLRAGDVQWWREQLPEALDYYTRARRIRERLVHSNPGDDINRRNLTVTQVFVGDVQLAQDHAADALQSYTLALEIMEQLTRSDPSNADWQIDLVRADARVGDALVALSKVTQALEHYANAISVLQTLVKADPDYQLTQQNLAGVELKKGIAEVTLGHDEQALELYLQAREIRERFAGDESEDRQNQFELARVHEAIGDLRLQQGAFDLALNSLSSGLGLLERITTAAPDNARWQYELERAYSHIAHAYAADKHTQEAKAAMSKAREILVKLVADHPDMPNCKVELATIDNEVAAYSQ